MDRNLQKTSMIISMMGNFGLSLGQTCDEDHIAKGFEQLGIEVFKNEIPEGVDLILTFKNKKYGPNDVKEWKKKAPVWVWSFDNMERFQWFYDYAKECDLWLGEELGRREYLKQKGLPFYYFPYHAVPPDIFRPIPQAKIYDVVFTGTPYSADYKPDKFELLKAIQDHFDLHIFGNNRQGWENRGFKNVHDAKFDSELSEIYSQSRVVVAISNCQCEGYWSIRTSQALMCGSCVVARFTPQMEKELRDSVVYFEDIDGCLKKIDYLLNHQKEAEAIAQRGYLYARACLTTVQRLKELLLLYEFRGSLQ